MASTVDIGACAIFLFSSALSPGQIDAVRGGGVPTSTNTTGAWTRLFMSADSGATLSWEGPTVELKTIEEGLKSVAVTGPDTWTLDIPIADLSSSTFKKLLQLNPNLYSSSSTFMYLNSNITGTNLLANGLPMAVVHKSYQNLSTGTIDQPVWTDPTAFIFVWAGLGERKGSIAYDPTKQQIFDVKMKMINTTGTTYSNVMGAYGALTPFASTIV